MNPLSLPCLGLAAAFVAASSHAANFTIQAPVPFTVTGASGSILPVTADELLPGPTCTSGDCFSLADAIYYRVQLDTGTLVAATTAFLDLGIGIESSPVGYVADDDPATRRPAGVNSSLSAPYERGPSFFSSPMVAGERSEVLFRGYLPGAPVPATPQGSFRVTATIGGAAIQFAPIALVELGGDALSLQRVASGLDRPVFATAPPGDPRLFVVEQTGRIRIVSAGALLPTPFLDLSAALALDPFSSDDERGLLGLAFAPDYAQSGLFYVLYVRPDPGDLDGPGLITVARHAVSANPNAATPAGTILLSIAKPAPPAGDPSAFEAYHNGGQLAFGPDGLLYVGIGDGGGWLGYDPWECAQNPSSPLGKLLRLDLSVFPAQGVAIPGTSSCPMLPSPAPAGLAIWARGLRNPYRFSFDRTTGDLYLADVGQDELEEINVVAAAALAAQGPNFGWDVMEGTACVGNDPSPAPPCGDPLLTLPVYSYGPGGGGFCGASVIGGYVYRGAIPELAGRYFFSDFCQGFFRSFQWNGAGGIVGQAQELDLAPDVGAVSLVSGIGQDAAGELYVVDYGFGPNQGQLFRLVPEADAAALALASWGALALLARGSSRGVRRTPCPGSDRATARR